QEVDPNLPLVKIDDLKVLEVLINLLSNAIKFSNEGGKVYITASGTPDEISVSVRDEGHGIESQDIPHIFEKFYRAQKESSKLKGTGLGLSLCKSIVERHSGRIWAESPGRGKGATFHFTLPVK
ncbi:MAG TPA: ATP-binding protein, partial [Candidatus Omnitrophota bacterium]|nr:ATP-binding protein [Candidatus Omnitrophota bacterium]